MDKKRRNRLIIIICFILLVVGVFVLSYNYFVSKRDLAFETINLQIDGNREPEEINRPVSEEAKNDSVKEVRYGSSYIGILEIPKINLTKGFAKIGSPLNNVDRGLQVIKPSDYPDVAKGNLIISSHSGNSSISYFKHLYKLNKKDIVNVYYGNKKYTYTIVNIYTQPKTGQVAIYRNYNVSVITLITCTKNDNTKQTIYIGELSSVSNYKEV